jgi:hypothetical protein
MRATTMRPALLLIRPTLLATAAILLGISACETQAPFAACELDVEVTTKGICTGSGKGGDTSCVVTAHPHCDSSVCLSYYSKPSICTKSCTTNTDCGSTACCWTFKDDVSPVNRYCVPLTTMGKTACP